MRVQQPKTALPGRARREMRRARGRANGVNCVRATATPPAVRPPTAAPAKRSKAEKIKEESDFLRHPLMEELANEKDNISEEAMNLLKFHGSYQQDHREERSFSDGKQFQFMMRTRQPAGIVSNQLYKAMDDLSEQYGNGTLRLTNRQTFQLHGVLKYDLKTVFSTVIKNMGSTLSACGDVNRNTMAPPAPFKDRPEYEHAQKLSNDIADLLAPQSGAYYDVWLDGEKFMSHQMESPAVTQVREENTYGTNYPDSPEPIYGSHFMPRKFKVGVTVPGDNHLDVFTNDIAVTVIPDGDGNLKGANIAVGGGMGKTHGKQETSPFIAKEVGYVPREDILRAVKAIACTQRDYGRRDDRRQARLKYLVRDWGVDRFREVVEQYMGREFEAYDRNLPEWEFKTYLGWGEQGDGLLYRGVHVQNGRLKGEQKAAVRRVVERFELPVTITANQDLILREIDPAWQAEIDKELFESGAPSHDELPALAQTSMACPAMPLCGLAIAEGERGLPAIQDTIINLLHKVGLGDEPIIVRMTGCPNGCARPYMAELGFVGDTPNSYEVWLGGNKALTRLAEPFAKQVKVNDIASFLEPILYFFKARRQEGEHFGDFVNRVGFEMLRTYQGMYVPLPSGARSPRVNIDNSTFSLLKSEAERRDRTLSDLASEAIQSYLTGSAE